MKTSDYVIVRLNGHADAVRWLRLAAGKPVEAGDGFPDVRREPVCVIVPGASVSHHVVALPARSARTLAQALPFALEDKVVGDVETLHFVAGTRGDDGTTEVTVVAHEQMDRWKAVLRDAGIDPVCMVPETLLLPRDAANWHLWLEDDSAWLGAPGECLAAFDRENAALMIEARLDELPPERRPRQLTVTLFDERRPDDAALDGLDDTVAVHWHTADGDLLRAFAHRLDEVRQPLNLLVGVHGHREALGRMWRPWRAVAGLLLAWGLLQVAAQGWQLHRLSTLQTDLERRMEQIYQQTFPGTTAADPKRQMASALARLDGRSAATAGGLAQVLAVAAPALAADPGIELRSLRFLQGELDLDLRLTGLDVLERLRERLAATQEWQVEIRSANALEDRVESRLVLRRVGT